MYKSMLAINYFHIPTVFCHKYDYILYFSENITEDVDVETVDKDVKLLTYRPSIDTKPMDHYRISKSPRDPENWEDSINKYVTTINLLY